MIRQHVTGRFRLHFNRHGAAPRVWSIDVIEVDEETGEELECEEINVEEIHWSTPTRTVYRPKSTPDDDGKPSAWLETEGTLIIIRGKARII